MVVKYIFICLFNHTYNAKKKKTTKGYIDNKIIHAEPMQENQYKFHFGNAR